MKNTKTMWVSGAIVLLVVGFLGYLTLNKNKIMSEQSSAAQNGDMVSMNYTGRLENGTVFDSNVDPKFNHVEPFEFVLGAGQVIPGWDKNIVGMKVGEKKTITIPPEEAYGENGVGDIIPPNSTLIFDVEVVNITKTNNNQ